MRQARLPSRLLVAARGSAEDYPCRSPVPIPAHAAEADWRAPTRPSAHRTPPSQWRRRSRRTRGRSERRPTESTDNTCPWSVVCGLWSRLRRTTDHGQMTLPSLLDTGRLTSQAAQVIQLRAPHLALADDLDRIEPWRVQQERALDADAVRCDPPEGEVLINTAAAAANHHALEVLRALAVALDDAHADAYRVANSKVGQVRLELPIFDLIENFLRHALVAPLHTKSGGYMGESMAPPPASCLVKAGSDYSIGPGRRQIRRTSALWVDREPRAYFMYGSRFSILGSGDGYLDHLADIMQHLQMRLLNARGIGDRHHQRQIGQFARAAAVFTKQRDRAQAPFARGAQRRQDIW